MTLKSCSTLWSLGLSEEEQALLCECAGPEYTLRGLDGLNHQEMQTILEQGDSEDPLLCFLGTSAWLNLTQEAPATLVDLCCIPTVLLLPEQAGAEMFRQALEGRFQHVLPGPLCSRQIFDAMRNAREAHNLVRDMERMSREISIGRELLERKSQTLDFLLDFVRAVDNATSFQELLSECSLAMRRAVDAKAVHIAWWPDEKNVHYILGGQNPHGQNAKAWRAFFRSNKPGLDQLVLAEHCQCVGTAESYPENGKILLMPLNSSGNASGFLAVHLNDPIAPGKDLTRALASARNHLALSLDAWFRSHGEENQTAGQMASEPEVWHIRRQA